MSELWTGSAPSNIALIKYMGKIEASEIGARSALVGGEASVSGAINRPTNRSLSWTLEHLRTHVELVPISGTEDRWEPLISVEEMSSLSLSEAGRSRFLRHLARLKSYWGVEAAFLVRSANDFPSDCGLASSASSFAALTRTACAAFAEWTGKAPISEHAQAELSRLGSGSSCRSFFSPWALWDIEGARAVELPNLEFQHQALVVEDGRKAVSSSEAHQRVTQSLLFRGRPERAEERLRDLLSALEKRDWRAANEIVWVEFWDMHALFETSSPPFGYLTAGSMEVLAALRSEMARSSEVGPMITMDAGANVHLLYGPDSIGWMRWVRARFGDQFRMIGSDRRGR